MSARHFQHSRRCPNALPLWRAHGICRHVRQLIQKKQPGCALINRMTLLPHPRDNRPPWANQGVQASLRVPRRDNGPRLGISLYKIVHEVTIRIERARPPDPLTFVVLVPLWPSTTCSAINNSSFPARTNLQSSIAKMQRGTQPMARPPFLP
jgi:hypothetical protein